LGARKIWEEEYPNINYEEVIIDAGCMRLVQAPEKFDVLLMENLYGDLVSDLCAGLVGGLGVVPGRTSARKSRSLRRFTAARRTSGARDMPIPLAIIMSGVMMLKSHSRRGAGDEDQDGYDVVLAEGKTLTRDSAERFRRSSSRMR